MSGSTSQRSWVSLKQPLYQSSSSTNLSLLSSVALSYYPCGAFLAFILHSYMTIENTLREYSFIWALCFGIVGALFATLVLTISKAVAKRIVWLHYYVLAVGSALLLVAGIVCTQNYGNWGKRKSHLVNPWG